MVWTKNKIRLDSGEIVDAQSPIIVSASRSTDIPAFYADWFFNRLERGYSAWTNPFNGSKCYISYQNTRFIVFWSKNPKPLIPYLAKLRARNIGCYIQFTLNDYVAEGLEKSVPSVDERIHTFKELVGFLGGNTALAIAVGTRLVDLMAKTVALRAGGLGLNRTEHGAPHVCDHAGSVALAAGNLLAAFLAAGAVAGLAWSQPLIGNLLGYSRGNFLQGKP